MISCVLLTAGHSQRFGSPKALAKINDKTVIECIQNQILTSQIDHCVVVLGAHAQLIEPYILKHKRVRFVYNKDYNLGQTTSFQVGLKEISPQTDGVFLWPIDYPFIGADTIDRMIDSFQKELSQIIVPVFQKKHGHPPLFSFNLKEEFLSLKQDEGLNSVARQNPDDTRFLSVDDRGVIESFNTQAELEEIKKVWGII